MDFNDFKKQHTTDQNENITHLLLDGGKLNIPSELEEDFIKAYSDAILDNQTLMVVEKRPEIFRFMMDVDIIDEHYWDNEKIKKLAIIIQKVVYDFYKIDFNVICCVAPPKQRNEGIKTGVHFIWPRLFINSENALLVRDGIIFKLQNQTELNTINNWEDVIDKLVYTRCGYRMVYSDKLDPKTRKPENRPYQLEFVIDSNGNNRDVYYNRLEDNLELLVKETSIRKVLTTNIEITKIPEWMPSNLINNKIKVNNNKTISYIDVNDEIAKCIIKSMKKTLPQEYENQTVKDIKKYPDGNYLIITDSKYCMNINREHNSCGIYFLATPMGIYQKCLCPCINLKDRITGYCKDYTSMCYSFTDLQNKLLFEKNNKKKKDTKDTKKTKEYYNVSYKNQKKDVYINNYSKFCDEFLCQM